MSYKNNSKTMSKAFLTDVKNTKCILCDEIHPLYKCTIYKNMFVSDRVEFVKSKYLCFNCLNNHNVSECRNKIFCSICRKRHHISLHFPREQKINSLESNE